ncbi:MAG: hypothetical protein QF464_03155, partial [Myxococcota bacterium]|nr:hypothetical protein [Myxococcota bacterium]
MRSWLAYTPRRAVLVTASALVLGCGGPTAGEVDVGGPIDAAVVAEDGAGDQETAVPVSDAVVSTEDTGGAGAPETGVSPGDVGGPDAGDVPDESEDGATSGDAAAGGDAVPVPACLADEDCEEDDDPCTDTTCSDGTCAHPFNTAPCDDEDGCTLGDTCAEGVCAGEPLICPDDDDPCTDVACIEDGCATQTNTAPCDDGDVCTSGDVCTNGICGGVPLACADDGDPCTTDDACGDLDGKWTCKGGATAEECSVCESLVLQAEANAPLATVAVDFGLHSSGHHGYVVALSEHTLTTWILEAGNVADDPIPGSDLALFPVGTEALTLGQSATDMDMTSVEINLVYVMGPNLELRQYVAGTTTLLKTHPPSGASALAVRDSDGMVALASEYGVEVLADPLVSQSDEGGAGFEPVATLTDAGNIPFGNVLDVLWSPKFLFVLDQEQGVHMFFYPDAESAVDQPMFAETLTLPALGPGTEITYERMGVSKKQLWVATQTGGEDGPYEVHGFEEQPGAGGIVTYLGFGPLDEGATVRGLAAGPCDVVSHVHVEGGASTLTLIEAEQPSSDPGPSLTLDFEVSALTSHGDCLPGSSSTAAGWLVVGGAHGGVGIVTVEWPPNDEVPKVELEQAQIRIGSADRVAVSGPIAYVADGVGALDQAVYDETLGSDYIDELQIFDTTTKPTQRIGQCDLEGPVVDIDTSEFGNNANYTYAAVLIEPGPSKLKVLLPEKVDCFCTSCETLLDDETQALTPQGLLVYGDQIFVTGQGNAPLMKLDAKFNPDAPTVAASLTQDQLLIKELGPAVVSSGWLYAGGLDTNEMVALVGIELVTIGTETPKVVLIEPEELIVNAPVDFDPSQSVLGLHADASHLYVLIGEETPEQDDEAVLWVIDISEPGAPGPHYGNYVGAIHDSLTNPRDL